MSDEKKTSLEDLLKSLTGHIVESVEITRENVRICEGNEGDILHVRISAIPRTDASHPPHETLDSKYLSFSILEADLLSRILGYFNESLQKIASNLDIDLDEAEEKKEISVTKDLTFSLTDVRKLLDHIKGIITETLRIRKREKPDLEAGGQ